jgi:hypothetical protein
MCPGLIDQGIGVVSRTRSANPWPGKEHHAASHFKWWASTSQVDPGVNAALGELPPQDRSQIESLGRGLPFETSNSQPFASFEGILAGIPNLADHAGQNMQCTLKEFTVQTHTNACRVLVTVEDARPPRDRLKHTANRQLGTHST